MRSINIVIGAILLIVWISILGLYFIYRNTGYLTTFFFVGVFLSPMLFHFLVALLGEELTEKIKDEAYIWTMITLQILRIILAGFLFIFGLYTVGEQIYKYLKAGKWESYSLIDGMAKLGIEWASNPTDWYGLWRVLDYIPFAVACIALAVTLEITREKLN